MRCVARAWMCTRCGAALASHAAHGFLISPRLPLSSCPPYTLTHTHTHTRTRICTRPPSSLQSPNELQDLLDVTRQLLEGLEATQRAATAGGVGDAAAAGGGGGLSADPDNDEFREKFRIVKASNV